MGYLLYVSYEFVMFTKTHNTIVKIYRINHTHHITIVCLGIKLFDIRIKSD